MKETSFLIKSFFFILLLFVFTGCTTDNDENEKGKANNLSLGVSANDLLSDQKYTSLKIELLYINGYEPTPATLSETRSFLQTYTHKPNGISITTRAIPSPGGGPYEISEIVDLEKENRTVFTSGKEIGVFIFFADGKSATEEGNKLVLGTAYRNTSMVIFEQTVKELSEQTKLPQGEIESTTIKHEFGHLFGLVDNGSPAQSVHEDTESKSHCNVNNCLMVAKVEFGSGTTDLLKSNHAVEFDGSCLRDLRANGGR